MVEEVSGQIWEYIPPLLAIGIELFPFPSEELLHREIGVLVDEVLDRPGQSVEEPRIAEILKEVIWRFGRSLMSICSVMPTFVAIWATFASIKEESWLIASFFISAGMALFLLNRLSRRPLRQLADERPIFPSKPRFRFLDRALRFRVSQTAMVSLWIYSVNAALCIALYFHGNNLSLSFSIERWHF